MGRIAYSLKKRWKDGTTHVVMTKQVLMWLCALVPKPRKHLATYHWVLAKAAGLRAIVVPNQYTAHQDLSHADARVENLQAALKYVVNGFEK